MDGAASRVLEDAADVAQGLVWRVLSALSFAFLGGGRHAVGVPLLELVEAGGEGRSEPGVVFLSLRCAGVF